MGQISEEHLRDSQTRCRVSGCVLSSPDWAAPTQLTASLVSSSKESEVCRDENKQIPEQLLNPARRSLGFQPATVRLRFNTAFSN